jgi:LVIVD repeat-containing protein
MSRALLMAVLLLVVAAPAARAQQGHIGPDYVSSANLDLVDRIKLVGDGVGATIVGNYMYVTSTKSLDIFDINSDPEHPKQVGLDTLDVEFENEEVPTNGKLLGISGQEGCANFNPLDQVIGCLSLYDVSDPSNVKYLTSVSGAGDHTSACIFDCGWLWGSAGTITDAHDPAHAKIVGNWIKAFPDGTFDSSCHHVREIQPGIVLGSCQPILLLSARAEDGGTPLKPVIIATGRNADKRFIHSSRWPRHGADRFMLGGGETNASPQCNDTVGAFMVWDASHVIDGHGGFVKGSQFNLLDEIRPVNGTYLDGHSPYNGLGCSVHWFEEIPTFHNGGAVALAEYENGTHILQITPQGKIVDKDYFLPLAGSTSAPHWNRNGKVIYSIDYGRGVDVLRYTGPDYVPAGGNEVAATNAACASAAGFRSVKAKAAGAGLKFSPSLRAKRGFSVEVFQQSSGRTVLKDRLVAKFSGKKRAFTWNGRSKRGRLRDGSYYARFTMRLADGTKDVRIVALRRAGGRFRTAPAFAQKTGCGLFTKYTLSSAVFGGRKKVPLRFTYKLAHDVDGVTVTVTRGGKVIKRFVGAGSSAKAYSFSVAASAVPKDAVVKVRATVKNGPGRGATLTAKRL